MIYKSYFHPSFKKDIKKLPKNVLLSADKITLKIEIDPFCSQKLSGDLSFIFRHKFKVDKVDYRIAYTVDNELKSITFIMIKKREKFYEQLKNRVLE